MIFTSFAITLPETAISDILASVSGIFSDLTPLILLLLAIPIGFWILKWAINIFGGNIQDKEWYEHDPLLNDADKNYYRRKRYGYEYDEDDDPDGYDEENDF